jgi:hypothetical protein
MLTLLLDFAEGVAQRHSAHQSVVETEVGFACDAEVELQDVYEAEPGDGDLAAVREVEVPLVEAVPGEEAEEEDVAAE